MTNTFLLNDFYSILSKQKDESGKLLFSISLNPKHDIFKGHFEQMPIVPGVCQTQIIKELLQEEIKKNGTLHKGDNIKFMGMIIPSEHPVINLEIQYKTDLEKYIVEAKLFFEETTFTKFKGEFIFN